MRARRKSWREKRERSLKLLGIYTGVILLIFAIFIPLLNQAGQEELTPDTETAMAEKGELPQAPVAQNGPVESTPVPLTLAKEKTITSSVPVTQSPVTQAPAAEQPEVDLQKTVWPIRGEISQNYGMRYSKTYSDYRFHNGIDIKGKGGSEIRTVLPGRVSAVSRDKSALTTVVIDHGLGWQSIYAQLEDCFVEKGTSVQGGDALGLIGQPGMSELLEGPHLHFALLKNGREVNPLEYLPR